MFRNCFRGFTEEDFDEVANFFDRAVNITIDIKKQTGSKIKDFKQALQTGTTNFPELEALGKDVRNFSRKFPTIGF